jgi:serine/threonine-protein kinase
MPYVEGESLRDRLTREKQLPLDDALKITRDVAEALGYAHQQGVVHRDIKPENILLHGGHAVVMDFGIARALTVAGGDGITESGIAVGTPAYMSPEQGSGSGEPDARSDIYSLGCVLYEMLAGHPPFTGSTAQEVLSRHALDPVPSLRAARNQVPAHVEQAVVRALAKQPADRFPTAAQFASALTDAPPAVGQRPRRRVVAATGLGLLALLAVVAYRVSWPAKPASVKSIAVLRCANLSTDSADAYFAQGMAEDLINALNHVGGLRVPAPTSSFALSGSADPVREAGERLNVAAVLTCTVRRMGSSLRVGAQLVNVTDGYLLWSDTYARELTQVSDIFAVQDQIVRAIAAALEVRLSITLAVARPIPENTEANDLYLKGRYFWNRRSRADLRQAVRYFQEAIEADSTYAPAYSGLADAYVIQSEFNYEPAPEVYPKAVAAARRAVHLGPEIAEAHVSWARVHHGQAVRNAREREDFGVAEREYQRALELNPRYALGHSWFGIMLARDRADTARFAEAVEAARTSHSLDPLNPGMNQNLGVVLNNVGRLSEAIPFYESAIELAPDWRTPRTSLAAAYLRSGRIRDALSVFRQANEQLGATAGDLAQLGSVTARAGNTAEAMKIRDQLASNPRTVTYWRDLAMVYAGLGEKDSAFVALARGRAAGFGFGGIRTGAVWDPLRSDPRFDEFVRTLAPEP